MVRVKFTPKKVDLAKLQAKKEAKKESGKKKGPKQATLKTFFKVDYRYSRPDPKVILPKTKSTKQPTPEEAKAAEMQRRREADDLRWYNGAYAEPDYAANKAKAAKKTESSAAPPDPPVLALPPPVAPVAPAPYVSAGFYQPSYLDDTEDELPEEDGDATRVVEGMEGQ